MKGRVKERPGDENEFVDMPAYQRMREAQWRATRNRIIQRYRELEGRAKVTRDVCSCGRHYAIGIYDEKGDLKTVVCPREYYVVKFLYYSLDPHHDPLEFVREHDMKAFLERLRIKEGEDGSRGSDGARGGQVPEDFPIQGVSSGGEGGDPGGEDR